MLVGWGTEDGYLMARDGPRQGRWVARVETEASTAWFTEKNLKTRGVHDLSR
jgi:hypothetical protein